MTDIATRRLEAIREYTEFGSGFKIAMRDLEIRGAGSLLGNRQHGHMEAVGYDMYLKLLEEAVAMEKGEISELHSELEGCFVEAGTPLAVLRHMLTREEVQRAILQKALHLFRAPERAKYYFTPEVDKKIRASDAHSVAVRDGMELLIMSRMKREVPLHYTGPDGVIYAVYFKYSENMDTGAPLIGVCPQDQLPAIQDVIMRVQTEWTEKE